LTFRQNFAKIVSFTGGGIAVLASGICFTASNIGARTAPASGGKRTAAPPKKLPR
jgi:hypothetical protein